MKLYHGTTASNLNSILDRGLMPRGKRDSRWDDNPSRADSVYLTDSYAPYFCFAGSDAKQMGLVVEVDTERLNDERLLPDEDACEQIMRGKDDVKGDLQERVKHYRRLLHCYSGRGQWQISLKFLGTCAHHGKIFPRQITRIAVIPSSYLLFWDAQISRINYAILGAKYRAMTARLFGDPPEADARMDTWWKMPMEHEVIYLNGSTADRPVPIGTFGKREKKEREFHPMVANRTTIKHDDERNIAALLKQADRALAGAGIAGDDKREDT